MTDHLLRPTNLVAWTGSATTTTGGLMMAQGSPAGSVQGNAGIVVALCGMASILAPLFFKDRSEERAANVRDLRRENADLKAELVRVKAVAADVPVNRAKIGAVEGKAEALAERLDAADWLAPPRPADGRYRARATVLIVEDDPDAARLLSWLLTREGYLTTFAADLDEGGRLLDLVPGWLVLDLRVQGRDGLDLLRRVRDRDLPTRVAVVTAAADPARLAAVQALRPDALLGKPVDFDDLLRVLAAAPAPPAPAPPEAPA